MFLFLIIIITLIAAVMTFLVLIQSGKGGGLAGIAAGGATTQILGARQAPDVLEKATWVLAAIFIVLCIMTNFAIDEGPQRSILQQQGTTEQGATQPLAPLPQDAQGGDQQTQPAPAPETPAPDAGTPDSQN